MCVILERVFHAKLQRTASTKLRPSILLIGRGEIVRTSEEEMKQAR
jgi:hypothetical protein